jgi:succinate dehydrogenase/fumarate reductase flavoprotein subunit
MEHVAYDILVLGSGGAGLRAAITACEADFSVGVISRGNPGKFTCTAYSAGVMAGSTNRNHCQDHLERTLLAGRGLNDPDLANILAAETPQRLQELMEWGIQAEYQNGWLYAKGRPPFKGEAIIRCLLNKSRALGVHFKGHLLVTDLLVDEGTLGILTLDQTSRKWTAFTAKAVILATDGAAALYQRHDNPTHMLGDGYRLAFEAGAVLQDMEFVQFYPLCLAEPGSPPLVIPPKLADLGRLINSAGEEIHEKYDIHERPAGEKARDRLSQAMMREIHHENQVVRLDLRDVSEAGWRIDPFSAGMKDLLGGRYGAGSRPIRVAPAAHHVMGGVKSDAWGATGVPGLLAAGEVTGGLHGANRAGGNALSDILVFGARAGLAAANHVRDAGRKNPLTMVKRLEAHFRQRECGPVDGGFVLAQLQQAMWENGGIIRNAAGLSNALNTVRQLVAESSQAVRPASGSALIRAIECRSALRVAGWILEAALQRCESRGSHFRDDFPKSDDAQWLGHLQVHQGSTGNDVWHFERSRQSGTVQQNQ